MNRFEATLESYGKELRRDKTEILQINVGKLCNLACVHCHVNAGPKRKEVMTRETVDRILEWFARSEVPTLDITGGAPEMIPDFRYLIEEAKQLRSRRHIIDRCNLTVLVEQGYTDLPELFARHQVEIVASMPCYAPENVNAQRGEGVFDDSIRALQILNEHGYGRDPNLPLHLVYNPVGAFLPAPQEELEHDYKVEMEKHFGIVFNHLYTLVNMPIARFASYLKRQGEYQDYMALLANAFNPATVDGLMCRNTLNVGWQGEVYDCDFNQMLDLQWRDRKPLYLWDIDPNRLEGRRIMTGEHCFGCTAGAGSSCGGAILDETAVEEAAR